MGEAIYGIYESMEEYQCRQKQKIMRLRKNNYLWGWYMDYYGIWHR